MYRPFRQRAAACHAMDEYIGVFESSIFFSPLLSSVHEEKTLYFVSNGNDILEGRDPDM